MEDKELIQQLILKRDDYISQLSLLKEKIEGLNQAIKSLSPNTIVTPSTLSDSSLIISKSYNPNSSYTDKILYLVSIHGKLSVKDIAALILTNEPLADMNKVFTNVTIGASNLLKQGKLKAEKEGKKNLYYI